MINESIEQLRVNVITTVSFHNSLTTYLSVKFYPCEKGDRKSFSHAEGVTQKVLR